MPTWICGRCTFENSQNFLQCKGCGTIQNIKSDINKFWICGACTFKNRAEINRCEMCYEAKEIIATVHFRPTPESKDATLIIRANPGEDITGMLKKAGNIIKCRKLMENKGAFDLTKFGFTFPDSEKFINESTLLKTVTHGDTIELWMRKRNQIYPRQKKNKKPNKRNGIIPRKAVKNRNSIFKIVVKGDSEVGKSNLINRYVKNTFDIESTPTRDDVMMKKIFPEKPSKEIWIWDTPGLERFRSMTIPPYKSVLGAVIVYDVTRRKTYENVTFWIKEFHKAGHLPVILVVGNKQDLRYLKEVNTEEASTLCEKNGAFFVETSSLTRMGVDRAFGLLIDEMQRRKNELLNRKSISQHITAPQHSQLSNEELRLTFPDIIASPKALTMFFRDFRGLKGVEIGNRRYRLRTYNRCFVSSEAISWLVVYCSDKDIFFRSRLPMNRARATRTFESLAELGYFKNVFEDVPFKDGHYYYRFVDDFDDQAEICTIFDSLPLNMRALVSAVLRQSKAVNETTSINDLHPVMVSTNLLSSGLTLLHGTIEDKERYRRKGYGGYSFEHNTLKKIDLPAYEKFSLDAAFLRYVIPPGFEKGGSKRSTTPTTPTINTFSYSSTPTYIPKNTRPTTHKSSLPSDEETIKSDTTSKSTSNNSTFLNLNNPILRTDQICFWINIYNIMVIHSCIQIFSGMDKSPLLTSLVRTSSLPTFKNLVSPIARKGRVAVYGNKAAGPVLHGSFYRHFKYNICSNSYTLCDIDTRILKPAAAKEPRIHFALANATPQGSRIRILHHRKINEMLDLCTQDYIRKQVFLRYSQSMGKFQFWMPELFNWYKSDFGCVTLEECAQWILQYVPFSKLSWDENSIKNLQGEAARQLQKLQNNLSEHEKIFKLVKWTFVVSPYRPVFWYDITHLPPFSGTKKNKKN